MVFVVFVALPLVWKLRVLAHTSEHLSYDEFIRLVETGQIKTVTVDQYSGLSGTQIVNGKEQPFNSYARTGSANDPLLLRLLREKGVPVTISNQEDKSPWCTNILLPILMFGIPIVTLIFVLLTYRKVKSSATQTKS